MADILTIRKFDPNVHIAGENPANHEPGTPYVIKIYDNHGLLVCTIETRDDEPRYAVVLTATGVGINSDGVQTWAASWD